jgi:hypothetical protein
VFFVVILSPERSDGRRICFSSNTRHKIQSISFAEPALSEAEELRITGKNPKTLKSPLPPERVSVRVFFQPT